MVAEMMGMDGIIALVAVGVLVSGGAAIPKLARNLGSARTEFERVRHESPSSHSLVQI